MIATKGRVFLVEDEDLISMMTEDMLAELGYEVAATAADLESGMTTAETDDFEVGVLDVNLHGRRSYPIAEILEARAIPYIFVSGYGADGLETRFANVLTLQKPFTASALDSILQKVRPRS